MTPNNIATKYLDKSKSEIPIYRQCELLGISKSAAYYDPVPVSPEDLILMKFIDKNYTDFPSYGDRIMAHQLTLDVGYQIGRKRTGTLMENMGIEAVYPKPRLSFNNKPHSVFPYLLKDVTILIPNHVWSARYILFWKLSDSLKTDFCLEAAHEALTINVPGIINVDQGVQFTDSDMIAIWQDQETQISMDHKDRCFDNIFTERFWRTLKYEEVYLKDYKRLEKPINQSEDILRNITPEDYINLLVTKHRYKYIIKQIKMFYRSN